MTAPTFRESGWTAPGYLEYLKQLESFFETSPGTTLEKLENFPKYVPGAQLARFLTKYEIFRRVLRVHGSVIECGVLHGGGLMTWAHLSAILEPTNHQRRIVGFDTFGGFTRIAPEDEVSTSDFNHPGGYGVDSYTDLRRAVELYDMPRTLSQIEKVALVRGDIAETLPRYLEENPQTVVSLLYLDVDLFEPTVAAIRHLLPRMPKGAVLAFDELNLSTFPGETLAVLAEVGLRNLRIERLDMGTSISFAVLD